LLQYHLAELVGLGNKEISKADKIMKFINLYKEENDNLNTQNVLFNANEKSIDYIVMCKEFNQIISDNIIEKTEQLIIIMRDNDILLDHSTFDQVACFFITY
jgi:hypothetical protein